MPAIDRINRGGRNISRGRDPGMISVSGGGYMRVLGSPGAPCTWTSETNKRELELKLGPRTQFQSPITMPQTGQCHLFCEISAPQVTAWADWPPVHRALGPQRQRSVNLS